MIVGFKCWYADGGVRPIGVLGRSRDEVWADVQALPATGLQVIVEYFDQFSTITCRSCRNLHIGAIQRGHEPPPDGNQPWTPARRCRHCGEHIDYDTGVRLRNVLQSHDYYFVVWDTQTPTPLQDWLIGQTNNADDVARYAGAKVMTGSYVNSTAFTAFVHAAMADLRVSDLGLEPQPGTTDSEPWPSR